MGIATIADSVTFRGNMRGHIGRKFVMTNSRSKNVETSVYNYCIYQARRRKIICKWSNGDFVVLYKDRMRTIMNNLSDYVLNLMREGAIKSRDIGGMSIYELNPLKWNPMLRAKDARDRAKFETSTLKRDSLFVCKRCKSRNCVDQVVQTRSGDEGSTTYVTCSDCGCNWKIH